MKDRRIRSFAILVQGLHGTTLCKEETILGVNQSEDTGTGTAGNRRKIPLIAAEIGMPSALHQATAKALTILC
jgi:hypothetical protein